MVDEGAVYGDMMVEYCKMVWESKQVMTWELCVNCNDFEFDCKQQQSE